MMIRNAIATPKPAVTLRSIDECASVGLIVILLRLTEPADAAEWAPRHLIKPGTQRPKAARTCHAPQRRKEFRKNRTKSSFLGSHDCRAPLTSHSPHLHDRSLMRGTLTQKQALESVDRRNLFSRAFASHYSASRVVPRFFSHRSFRGLAYCHREHVAQLRHDNHSDVKGHSLPFCGSSLQSGPFGRWFESSGPTNSLGRLRVTPAMSARRYSSLCAAASNPRRGCRYQCAELVTRAEWATTPWVETRAAS